MATIPVYGKIKPVKNIYDTNDTMKIVGKQVIEISTKACKEITDITRARAPQIDYAPGSVQNAMQGLTWDIFILGYIYGKRAEREKRAKKTTQTA